MRIISRIQEWEHYYNSMIWYVCEIKRSRYVLSLFRWLLCIHIERWLSTYKKTIINKQIRITSHTKFWDIGFIMSIKLY